MVSKALDYECPRWEWDPDRQEDIYVWHGRPRFVSAKRARKLRKRGVPLMPCHAVVDRSGGEHRPGMFEPRPIPGAPGTARARYAWFEREENYTARKLERRVKKWLALDPWKRTAVTLTQQLAGLDLGVMPDKSIPYILQILPQSPEDRAARKSPPIQMLYWGDPI